MDSDGAAVDNWALASRQIKMHFANIHCLFFSYLYNWLWFAVLAPFGTSELSNCYLICSVSCHESRTIQVWALCLSHVGIQFFRLLIIPTYSHYKIIHFQMRADVQVNFKNIE